MADGEGITDEIKHTIDKMVADWPPLTTAQRDRLAVLLRGDGGQERGAA
ncbi:MAG: hypothetical protein QOE23_2230 [Pseudonocardiales bacterium]|jgi:hypothetical protein|nr:hypothetical protein [Pseudonocardiales bacterium]